MNSTEKDILHNCKDAIGSFCIKSSKKITSNFFDNLLKLNAIKLFLRILKSNSTQIKTKYFIINLFSNLSDIFNDNSDIEKI